MVSKPKLRLSFMTSVSDRVAPLVDGRVQPEGIELVHTEGGMSEGAWRHLNFHEFQVHELSISSYLISREQGADWIAIPVFPHRSFMHMNLHYHTDSGIEKPSDVVGKRIGVGEYQQTAALWMRGIIEHDHGVSQFKVDWFMERTEEMSHGGATGFEPQEGISFQRIPPDESLSSMLLANKRDGANATVTVCHTGTPDIGHFTRQADILVAAIGRARVITADMVKPGAVVIDVGINRVDDATRARGYRLDGDVDFEPVTEVAEAISPVPGGVGPMTVAMLLMNTVTAARTAVQSAGIA